MSSKLLYILLLVPLLTVAQTNMVIGDSLYTLGNFKKAKNFYEKERSVKGQLKLAKTYQALGKTSLALAVYKKVVEADPSQIIATYQYAELLFRSKKYLQADTLYKNLAKKDPRNLNYVYKQALVKEQLKDTTAIFMYMVIVSRDSTHRNANYKVARKLVQKRNFLNAQQYIDNGLAEDALSTRFLSLQALIYFYTKGYHKAVSAYEQLLSLEYINQQVHQNLAVSYARTNQFEKAIVQYKILLSEYNDKNAAWHFDIGKMYFANKETDKGIGHIETAIAILDTPLDTEYLVLATMYTRKKDYKKVFELMGNAVKENPNNEMIRYQYTVAGDNYFKDTNSIIRLYEAFIERYDNGRYSELAKQRLSDLKSEQHFNKE